MARKLMIEVFGEGAEYEWAAITQKKADQITSGSMDEDELNELLQENSEFSISQNLISLTLKVNSKQKVLTSEVLTTATEPIVKWPDKKLKHHFIVRILSLEGLLYKAEAPSLFDVSKLKFTPYHFELGASGIVLPVTVVSYAGLDSEDLDCSYTDSIVTLYSPSGEAFQIDGESGTSDAAPAKIVKRVFCFKDEATYKRYIEHIESNIRPEIAEGLSDISDITMLKVNKGYEITFVGAEIDLSSLPVSTMGWVAEEIGTFKDHWIK